MLPPFESSYVSILSVYMSISYMSNAVLQNNGSGQANTYNYKLYIANVDIIKILRYTDTTITFNARVSSPIYEIANLVEMYNHGVYTEDECVNIVKNSNQFKDFNVPLQSMIQIDKLIQRNKLEDLYRSIM